MRLYHKTILLLLKTCGFKDLAKEYARHRRDKRVQEFYVKSPYRMTF